jgi:hypothetical protein
VVQFPAEATDLCFLQKKSRPAVGPTQPHIQPVSELFLAVKRAGLESGHSPPSSAEVKIKWSYTLTSPYAVMACTRNLTFVFVLY